MSYIHHPAGQQLTFNVAWHPPIDCMVPLRGTAEKNQAWEVSAAWWRAHAKSKKLKEHKVADLYLHAPVCLPGRRARRGSPRRDVVSLYCFVVGTAAF